MYCGSPEAVRISGIIGSENGMKRKISPGLTVIAVLLAALAALTVYLLVWKHDDSGGGDVRGDASYRQYRETVFEKDGIGYAARRHLTTVLVMGIDKTGDVSGSVSKRNGGQADFLSLIVIDDEEKKVTRIAIDRDTMTPITILGILGGKSGVRTAQICLSHGFGDGKQESCLLTCEAVSNLMFGIGIDDYAAVDLTGIPALNDIAGGVSVTLDADYTMLDPDWTAGAEVTFSGEEAELFVRSRQGVDDGTNVSRMARQETYLAGLTRALIAEIRADRNFAGDVYDALERYLVTDMNRGKLTNLMWEIRDYTDAGTVSIAGRHAVGTDGFVQFWYDEEDLFQTVCDIFYEQVEDIAPKG